MNLPNYHDGSIVNLMSSIAESFGAKTMYNPLKILPSEKLKDSKNIVLLIIDGLGYHYLKEKGNGTILNENVIGSMTSVFLPTTASGITTFLTGVAPQQHTYTGWYMHLKEIGVVVKILPFVPRVGGSVLSKNGVKIKDILEETSFFSKIKTTSFVINSKELSDSDFTKHTSKGATRLKYNTLNSMFIQMSKAIKSSERKKYIYAYWHGVDDLNHKYGVGSKESDRHLIEIDKKLRKFIESIKNTNTTLIITADHGFINTSPEKIIKLENHPKLKECLTLPLCGERRTVYCYVHPSKADDFEEYIKEYFSQYCEMYKSQELIDKNYFGLFSPNPKLLDRVGDYILIFKENYIFKDKIREEKKDPHIGHHGGVSKEEMIVPLIVINC